MKKYLVLLCAFFLISTQAYALTADGLTFTSQSGDVTLTSFNGSDGYFDLYETVTDLDVTIKIDGLSTYGNPAGVGGHSDGIWLTKHVLNNTGETWNFYDMELQSILGVASTNGDGLSFAQGSGLTWTSTEFSTFDQVTDVRDYINFYSGSVADGETASFTFAITHNGSADPVYLRQRPNFSTTAAPVPEPATMLLFGIGLLGMAGVSRRKK